MEQVKLSDADLVARGIDPQKRMEAQAYCIRHGILRGYTITDEPATCGKHGLPTTPSLLGLEVCPLCAAEILKDRRVESMAHFARAEARRRELEAQEDADIEAAKRYPAKRGRLEE